MEPFLPKTRLLLVNNQYVCTQGFDSLKSEDTIILDEIRFDTLPKDVDTSIYDGIFLSGTDISPVDKLEVYKNEISMILNAKCPILGICGGHLILTLAYGGEVGLLSYPIYGRTKAVALSNDFLLHNVPCPFTVLSKHRYYVKKPPANFQVIAKSIEQDIIYAVKLYDRHHYGVQFHPERRNDGTKILQNFIEIVRSLKVTYSKMPKKGEVY